MLSTATLEPACAVLSSGRDMALSRAVHTEWAPIWIDGYAGDDQKPVDVYFQRSAEKLTLSIVGDLAQACGPFLVMINNEVPRWVTG